MSPLRIAAHISAAEWGGAERRSLALLAELARRGHHVVVYCNTDRIAEKTREHGLEAVLSPLRGDVRIDHALSFARQLRTLRPDVLILVTFRRLLLGALAGRIARVSRTIARVGLASDVARSAKYRFVLKRWVDDVVLNAESLHAPFVASLAPGSRARVHVIPNGVERRSAPMERDQARAGAGVPPDAFVLGTVARLVRQKRHDRLIEAVAALDDVHAVIAGDGYLRSELEQIAGAAGVAHRIHFLGHREDVGNVMSMLDVYVVASDQEGMSAGMLEAMAARLPVVSTRVSGAEEALLKGPEAGIVTGFAAREIADAVHSLRQDSALRERLARAAEQVARERYGLAAMADRWETLIASHT